MKKLHVIYDCDNTMGLPGCDLDDGLTILFLLGCEEVDLIGITCSYGNSTQDQVFQNTRRLLGEWGREDIPIIRGAYDRHERRSPASEFLVDAATRYDGRLSIIATGAMTNLVGAAETDPDFFSRVRSISLMGGITEELFVGGVHMDELNLSCDPWASYRVLSEGQDVMIATAQNSLLSFYERSMFTEYLERSGGPIAEMLGRETAYWFDIYEKKWNCPGFVNWDVMAAVQLVMPESLLMKSDIINPDPESLEQGMLYGRGRGIEVTMPEIADHSKYDRQIFDAFFNAKISLRE